MKNVFSLIFLLLLAATCFSQEPRPSDVGGQPGAQQDPRLNMMREIGLSQDQIRQMRRLNMERRPLMEEAQTKLREANRLLDEAIYADDVSESDVQARLKEVQVAQAEVLRVRFTSELAIRRILTTEQLVHFRELRRRFEEARRNMEPKRKQGRILSDGGKTPGAFEPGGRRLRPFIRQNPPQKQP